MHQQVRMDLASATLGSLERYKILVEDDPQMLGAIELFPRASKLMSGVFLDDATDKAVQKAGAKTTGTAAHK